MDYLKSHYDLAIVLISHDLDYVKKYADHVVLLDQTVLKQGTVKEVFESPEFASVFATENDESWIYETKPKHAENWMLDRNKGYKKIELKGGNEDD